MININISIEMGYQFHSPTQCNYTTEVANQYSYIYPPPTLA